MAGCCRVVWSWALRYIKERAAMAARCEASPR
ncbi:MAG: helix-turn-helix domain-containing protein [Acidobacteriia bacterium]|nr:helix-turn-helix domain-containing protein [Terriglobia bacterium]